MRTIKLLVLAPFAVALAVGSCGGGKTATPDPVVPTDLPTEAGADMPAAPDAAAMTATVVDAAPATPTPEPLAAAVVDAGTDAGKGKPGAKGATVKTPPAKTPTATPAPKTPASKKP